MIDYKIKNLIDPAEIDRVRVLGSVGEQMNIFFDKRVFSDFARTVVYKETYDAFVAKRDDNTAIGYWQGEFWGKWVISACRVAKYDRNEELRAFLLGCARELLALQREDGYIGTYKDSKNVLPPPDDVSTALVGEPCPHNWNVWCRKYTLWGLLEVYSLTGAEDVLAGAKASADCLIRELSELGLRLCQVGTFNGLPPVSILKPMLILYSITEEEKYLRFCIDELSMWDKEDGPAPNLITNLLSEKPVHTWYPDSNKWAKAYEMLSCFDGMLELYRYTGNEKYLRAVINGHRIIKEYEYNAVFGISCNDVFFNAAKYQNACTEPCDTIHWMRVCYELFALTGRVEYMNDFEESFYTPFLAASYGDGEWGARGVRSSGRHMTCLGQAGMKHSHCCVNNMPRGYINFAQSVIMSGAGGLYINMYTDFEGEIKVGEATVKVAIGGDYLSRGTATVTAKTDAPITVNFRIPAFSPTAVITLNGEEISCTGATFAPVRIGAGVSSIALKFDMNPRVIDFTEEGVWPEEDDYPTRRYIRQAPLPYGDMAFGNKARVLYGPLLLTRSKKCGNTEAEMFEDKSTVFGTSATATVTPVAPTATRCLFEVTLNGANGPRTITMCDYATGSNEASYDDPRLFSIWV